MSAGRFGTRLAACLLVVLLAGCDAQTLPTATQLPSASAMPTPTGRATAGTSADPTDVAEASASAETPTEQPTPDDRPTSAPTDPPTPTPTATPTEPTDHDLDVWRTIPYATAGDCGERITVCQQFVDVYAPADDDGPYPVVVMAHGRPRTPADMAELAKAVASHGAVVFNIDYRGVRPVVQKGWPEAVEDVACAVRFARATAHKYGGDAKRIVLVGHSFGGYVGTLVSLDGDDFHGDCLTPNGSALPDAWVGVSANCTVGVPPPPAPLWDIWYGGTQEEAPKVWAKGDTLNHIGGNPKLVVRMVHERDDPIVSLIQPRTLVRELNEAGYDASLTVVDGDDHWGPLDVDQHAGQVTLDTILDLIGAS
jgi:acetyl esterase/lipase